VGFGVGGKSQNVELRCMVSSSMNWSDDNAGLEEDKDTQCRLQNVDS
jgi:hypothetical protein